MCKDCINIIRCQLLSKHEPLPLLIDNKLYDLCYQYQDTKSKSSYISPKWGAKVMKKILTAKYPQYKWSCKSSHFAGGNSVDVNYLDERYDYGMAQEYPEEWRAEDKEIDSICQQFEDGHFNGMTDSYEYEHNKPLACTKYCTPKRKSKRDWQYV